MAQHLTIRGGKAPYVAPKLAVYGEFSQLTASGAGSKTETNITGQPGKKP